MRPGMLYGQTLAHSPWKSPSPCAIPNAVSSVTMSAQGWSKVLEVSSADIYVVDSMLVAHPKLSIVPLALSGFGRALDPPVQAPFPAPIGAAVPPAERGG